jgi:hypothetical protein
MEGVVGVAMAWLKAMPLEPAEDMADMLLDCCSRDSSSGKYEDFTRVLCVCRSARISGHCCGANNSTAFTPHVVLVLVLVLESSE